MADPLRITDPTGAVATGERAPGAPGRLTLRLPSGRRADVPATLAEAQPDGSYRLGVAFADLDGGAHGEHVRDDHARREATLQEVEERLRVRTETHEAGRVRAHRTVSEERRIVDEPLQRERVTVERVPIGTYADVPQDVRQEGDTTIIPVYEEVLVVEKRLVLKEEVRLVRHRDEVHAPQEVVLRTAHVEVERLPAAAEPASEEAGLSRPSH